VIVFACIAPHGDLGDIPELRTAMEELGRRFDAAAPDVAIVVTPHNVHVDGHFAVVTAAHVGEWETDRDVAQALLAADLPILGVSYGGNVQAQSEMPLDWGTEVPLDFMRAERVVVVSPARDRPLEEHIELGREIAGNTLLGRRGSRSSRRPTTATRMPLTGLTGSIRPARRTTRCSSRFSRPAGSTFCRSPSTPRTGRPTRSGSSSSSRARWARVPT